VPRDVVVEDFNPAIRGWTRREEVRDVRSRCTRDGFQRTTLERDREEVLEAARPLPPDGETLIADLTEEKDRLFAEAIMGA
jgi:hypothetical protein